MESGARRPRSGCLVRLAGPTEYSRVIEIVEIGFGAPDSKDAVEEFRRRLEEARQFAILAFVGGDAVGCLAADVADKVIIYNLAVLPEHRRRGVAAELVEGAVAIIRATCQPESYWVAVHPDRSEGVQRFRRLGFSFKRYCRGYQLMRRSG